MKPRNTDQARPVRTSYRILLAGSLGLIVTLVSCATLEQLAPPVDPMLVELGAIGLPDIAALTHGRKVYLTNCVRCHGPEPVARYSLHRWPSIIDRMAKRTKLKVDEEADVLAYVLAARRASDFRMMPQPPPAGPR
ncbi:MAG: hypothetical protein O7C65_09735 [Planctomycetota bacterium]|nr:hypothetical protein [Planctomycetota bacterium]